MFTEEDEYMEDDDELEEEDLYDDDEDQESQEEMEDREMYFMGTQSQARKRFGKVNNFCSRNPYRNTFNRRQARTPYYAPNRDQSRSNPWMRNGTRVQHNSSMQQSQKKSAQNTSQGNQKAVEGDAHKKST